MEKKCIFLNLIGILTPLMVWAIISLPSDPYNDELRGNPPPQCIGNRYLVRKDIATPGVSKQECNNYAHSKNTETVQFEVYTYTPCRLEEYHLWTYCPSLDSAMALTAKKILVPRGEGIQLDWSLNNYNIANFEEQCAISGKAPGNESLGKFFGNFSEQSLRGSFRYDYAPRKIYTFEFECTGITDNRQSLDIKTIKKSAEVYIGDIRNPHINEFEITPATITRGESVKLSWDIKDGYGISINEGNQIIGSNFKSIGDIYDKPTFSTSYTITASGEFPEQKSVSKTIPLTVLIPPKPSVNIKVEPAVIKEGESATLSWTSGNSTSLSINQGIGRVEASGSKKVSPRTTTLYTITAEGKSDTGTAQHSATLKVVPAITPGGTAPEIKEPEFIEPPPMEESVAIPAPKEELKLDLKINGQDGPLTMGAPASFNLSWNLDKYCLAYGSWLGIKRSAGAEQRSESKAGTYTYKMYCPGVGGDEVTVNLVGGTKAPVALPVAEASISADGKNFSRSVRVVQGKPIKLWISAGYDISGDKIASRDETGKWTRLMSSGGSCEWNSALNKEPVFSGVTFDPESPKDCALYLGEATFYDKPGVYQYKVLRLVQNNGKISNIAYVNIAVTEPPPPDSAPVIDFRINGSENGQVKLGAPSEYVLSWNVKNADSCSASDAWDGEKSIGGSQKFFASSKRTLTYTITCRGKLGTTEKSVTLQVAELPVCEFSALPNVLDKSSVFERQSILSWKCQFANSCSIAPTVDIKKATFGSIRVSPKTTTAYTLSCENLEGTSSFDQVVEVR